MTELEQTELKRLIVMTALYYDKQFPDHVVKMYAQDLEDLPFERIKYAYQVYRRNPKNTRNPLPAQIRGIIEGSKVSDEDKAAEVASRITAAITKYGYCNWEGAKLYIGDIGVRIVDLQGGWTALCQRVQTHELPTYQAQWRHLAISTIHKAQEGLDHVAPELPSPEIRGFIQTIIKKLPPGGPGAA